MACECDFGCRCVLDRQEIKSLRHVLIENHPMCFQNIVKCWHVIRSKVNYLKSKCSFSDIIGKL